MTQTEEPGISFDEFEATIGSRQEALSGGQIENFRAGWAVNIMGGNKAHYSRRGVVNIGYALSACGTQPSSVRWLYGEGNFPRCKTCARQIK